MSARLDAARGAPTTFLVRFLGVRGSYPVPGRDAACFGGNTSCVEVRTGDYRVVLDLGTGLIELGDELSTAGSCPRLLMLASHFHHDHTMGFPFFKPVYDPAVRLSIAGPGNGGRTFEELLDGTFANPYFPVDPHDMGSRRTYNTLAHGDVLAWRDVESEPEVTSDPADVADDELRVRVFRNLEHPNGGVLNFRLERLGRSVVMATDVEGTRGETGDLVEFASGADLLIHDAQYTDEQYETKEGWGHSTWRMAADVARRADVARLALYHHDPEHDDDAVEAIERRARGHFSRSIAASEGLEVRI